MEAVKTQSIDSQDIVAFLDQDMTGKGASENEGVHFAVSTDNTCDPLGESVRKVIREYTDIGHINVECGYESLPHRGLGISIGSEEILQRSGASFVIGNFPGPHVTRGIIMIQAFSNTPTNQLNQPESHLSVLDNYVCPRTQQADANCLRHHRSWLGR